MGIRETMPRNFFFGRTYWVARRVVWSTGLTMLIPRLEMVTSVGDEARKRPKVVFSWGCGQRAPKAPAVTWGSSGQFNYRRTIRGQQVSKSPASTQGWPGGGLIGVDGAERKRIVFSLGCLHGKKIRKSLIAHSCRYRALFFWPECGRDEEPLIKRDEREAGRGLLGWWSGGRVLSGDTDCVETERDLDLVSGIESQTGARGSCAAGNLTPAGSIHKVIGGQGCHRWVVLRPAGSDQRALKRSLRCELIG